MPVADPERSGVGFFLFLRAWSGLPVVRTFLKEYGRFVKTSLQAIPEVDCIVWISQRRESG
ncbi:hypothetical protein CKQ16_19670 [Salmonella enterica subsp. enterica serovar Newport]|nr:hypothetical protein [Salmonella enterica subsp. enterica serovar Newport]